MCCGKMMLCGVAHKSDSECLYLLFGDDLSTKKLSWLSGRLKKFSPRHLTHEDSQVINVLGCEFDSGQTPEHPFFAK